MSLFISVLISFSVIFEASVPVASCAYIVLECCAAHVRLNVRKHIKMNAHEVFSPISC